MPVFLASTFLMLNMARGFTPCFILRDDRACFHRSSNIGEDLIVPLLTCALLIGYCSYIRDMLLCVGILRNMHRACHIIRSPDTETNYVNSNYCVTEKCSEVQICLLGCTAVKIIVDRGFRSTCCLHHQGDG
jgi:hypothetical protein